jgi:DNA-binding transcriptional regulator YdaS (Cro superfamily)
MGRKSCVERLLDIAGGEERKRIVTAARLLGTYRQVVANWKKAGYIPAKWALRVEEKTGGKIKAEEVLAEYENRHPTLQVEHPYSVSS